MVRTVFKIAEVVARRLVGSIPTRSRHALIYRYFLPHPGVHTAKYARHYGTRVAPNCLLSPQESRRLQGRRDGTVNCLRGSGLTVDEQMSVGIGGNRDAAVSQAVAHAFQVDALRDQDRGG